MKSTLHDLYNGRFAAWEHRPNRCAEYNEINRKIEEEKRYFMQKMSLDDCQRFEALESLYSQSSNLEQADAFAHSFKWAARLMCEVFMPVGNL